MDAIFQSCMHILLTASAALGISYEALNVIVFCVLVPAAAAYLLHVVVTTKAELHLWSRGRHGWPPRKAQLVRKGAYSLLAAGTAGILGYAVYLT